MRRLIPVIVVVVLVLVACTSPAGGPVTTTTARHRLEDLPEWAPALKDTAERIARAAEAWRFPAQTS